MPAGWAPRQKPAAVLQGAWRGKPQPSTSPHIMASPPGTPAPVHAINYTPKTGEIHHPGTLAPVHELNYSLIPHGGLGGGNEYGAGLDSRAGAGPPLTPGQEQMTGRYGAPASMASGTYQPGAPPMRPSPYGTGPGPRNAPSGPMPSAFGQRGSLQGITRGWGQGMGNEFGAGDDGDGSSQIDPGALSAAAGVSSANPDQSTGGADGGTQPVSTQPATATSAPGGEATPQQVQAVTPAGYHQDPPPAQQQVGDTVYLVSPDGSKRIPMFTVTAPPDPATGAPHIAVLPKDIRDAIQGQQAKNPNQQTKNVYNPDTGQMEMHVFNPQDGTLGPVIGVSAAPKSATTAKAGHVTLVGPDGQPHVYSTNPDGTPNQSIGTKPTSTSAADAAAVRAQSALDTSKLWSVQTDPATGGLVAVDLHDPTSDGGVVKLTGVDPTHGIYNAGNAILQYDPSTSRFNTIYEAPSNYTTTTIAGKTFAYDPRDPTKQIPLGEDPTYAPQAAATLDQTRANTQSLLQQVASGQMTTEQARETLLENVHNLLHPQPTLSSAGYLVPAGAELDVNYATVQGGPVRGTQHVSGGPIDADTQKIADQVYSWLDAFDKRQAYSQTDQSKQAAQPAATGQPAQAATGTPSGAQDTVSLPAGAAGVAVAPPGSTAGPDPRFAGVTPPSNVTTAMGDTAHYDESGNLSGITYRNTAPPHYGEAGYPGSEGYEDPSSSGSLDVGLDQSLSDGGDMGGGQEDFMGRGLTARAGRGSTGIGWQPRAQGAGHMSNFWQPKGTGLPGAGGEGGMGAGGVYVKYPDGSMHWDETKADPNPNGGSVISSTSGQAIPGANRQSGPSGPGGTGPAGSQAQAGHAAELQANPTFASTSSSPFLSNAWQTMGANLGQPSGYGQFAGALPGAPGADGSVGAQLAGGGPMGSNPWVAPAAVQPIQTINKQVDPFNTPSILTPRRDAMGNLLPPGTRPTMPGGGPGGGNEYGAGQGGTTPGGMPMGAQSPDYQRGYQDGMQASRNPGTPPLFVPGNQQPVPTMGDQGQDPSQGGGMPQGMGGGQDMGAGGPLEDLLGATQPMDMSKYLQTPMAVRRNLMRTGGWNDPNRNPPGGLMGQPLVQEFDYSPGATGTGHEGGSGMSGGGAGQAQASDPLYHFILNRRGQSGSRLGMGTGQGPSSPPPAGPPGGLPPGGPQAQGGAGWMPPLGPGQVAGIGHRFGQQMDQGEPSHSGIDLQAPEGTPTVSPVDGIVERVEHNPQGLGLTVIVRGKDGSEHRLGHLQHTEAYPGMIVGQGQDLQSRVGSTGNTTGAHLHWGVRDGQGQPQDPTGALPPGMQQMPPVPGTEMMGPPGGTGGGAQMPPGAPPGAPPGGPPMGGGAEDDPTALSDLLKLPTLKPLGPAFQAEPGLGGEADLWDPSQYRGYGTSEDLASRIRREVLGTGQDGQDGQGGDVPWSQIIRLVYPQNEGALAAQAGGYAPGEEEYMGWHPLNRMRRMGKGDITPPGTGQESADTRWDLYEARDTQGFWGPGAGQDDDGDMYLYGAGGEGGMGAGAVAGVTPDQQAAVDAQIQAATISAQAQTHAADQQYQIGIAQVNANIAAENDRHAEAISQLQQQYAFHQDDVALKQAEDAEASRHNQVTEQLQHEATQMQQTLEQLKDQNNIQLEQMQEANAVKLEQMKEGNSIYMQQGDQAFKDWQTTQADRMSILSSALNNPWLQQLTGLTPAPGQAGTATGGQNLANLIQQVMQPYNYQAWGGQGAQGQGAPPPQQAPAMYQGGGAPGIQTPTWSQWQGWNPFQMAAYRTNIEAMGPGVWNDVQGQMQTSFAGQGGSPNITQMQRAAADPTQQAGQEMTASLFGQTTPAWQAGQSKQWSQAQAPQVKENLSQSAPAGIAA